MRPRRPKTSIKVFALMGALLLAFTVAHASAMELISVSSEGEPGNGFSVMTNSSRAISADNRYVVFYSAANNLVPDDTNGKIDIFVRDRKTGITERVNIASDGTQANSPQGDKYHKNWGSSDRPSISSDGRFVVFTSYANNLVPNDNNSLSYGDVFVHDRKTGTTQKISSSDHYGIGQATISGNGRLIAYTEMTVWFPRTYVLYVYDSVTGTRSAIASGVQTMVSFSANGRCIAFRSNGGYRPSSDTPLSSLDFSFYIYDLETKLCRKIYAGSGGDGIGWSLNADGKHMAWSINSLFVSDIVAETTEHLPFGNDVNYPSISDNGQFIAFTTGNEPIQYGVFVYDREAKTTELANIDSDGVPRGWNSNANISPDGKFVAFVTNYGFDPNDHNGTHDVYLWNRTKDKDGDGYEDDVDCDDDEFNINPGVPEIPYNGADENCNGLDDDDDLDGDGFGIDADCDDNDSGIFPGAPEVKHDEIDQDCNGYDLTIEIAKARYFANSDKLRVEATSAWGQTAALEVKGYGPMKWDAEDAKWVINIKKAGGNPGTVTVSGREGDVSTPVELRPK